MTQEQARPPGVAVTPADVAATPADPPQQVPPGQGPAAGDAETARGGGEAAAGGVEAAGGGVEATVDVVVTPADPPQQVPPGREPAAGDAETAAGGTQAAVDVAVTPADPPQQVPPGRGPAAGDAAAAAGGTQAAVDVVVAPADPPRPGPPGRGPAAGDAETASNEAEAAAAEGEAAAGGAEAAADPPRQVPPGQGPGEREPLPRGTVAVTLTIIAICVGYCIGAGLWVGINAGLKGAEEPRLWPRISVTEVTARPPGEAKTVPPAPPAEGPYLVAHLPGDVTAYTGPGGEADGIVQGSWWGYASALPILEQQDGYLLVRLQQRPNESTAWIAADAVEITETPYRIEVDLAARRIRLLNLGEVELDAPAIIGRPETPTPAGHFFVTMLQPGPSAGYGDEVLVLSAHSETIDNWQGSGDAVIAIHGPLGNEESVDLAGAVSNGCVRIHLADLDALAAAVPPGTPVDILPE
ncbi:MAG: L,D-transpeptidase family protein [Bifidobacteriaceae bacterium]|jgi:hypothetical protein|nr:L,D-transpeptidase family protein [Bifidobacteriaceae bacterium]